MVKITERKNFLPQVLSQFFQWKKRAIPNIPIENTSRKKTNPFLKNFISLIAHFTDSTMSWKSFFFGRTHAKDKPLAPVSEPVKLLFEEIDSYKVSGKSVEELNVLKVKVENMVQTQLELLKENISNATNASTIEANVLFLANLGVSIEKEINELTKLKKAYSKEQRTNWCIENYFSDKLYEIRIRLPNPDKTSLDELKPLQLSLDSIKGEAKEKKYTGADNDIFMLQSQINSLERYLLKKKPNVHKSS